MNKNFFYLIALGMFFSSVVAYPQNSSLLKHRTVLRMENRSLYKIVKETGAHSPENALQKVTGTKTLFDQLSVDSVSQAVSAIDNLRNEFKQTLQNLEQNHIHEIALLKDEQHVLESEKNKLLKAVNADSVEKAVEKFEQMQSAHDRILQFAQQFKK